MFNNIVLNQNSILQLHVIDSIDFIFKTQKSNTFYWIDFHLKNENTSLFFSVNQQNKMDVFINPSGLTDVSIIKEKPADGREELIEIIEMKKNDKTYQIMPQFLKNEANSDKTKYWMGAIEIRDKNSREIIGVGNMFIL